MDAKRTIDINQITLILIIGTDYEYIKLQKESCVSNPQI